MSETYRHIPSPCFVLEEALLRRNLEKLKGLKEEAGIELILAFKGFAMWSAFPIIREYLQGATASSLHEARLGYEEMGTKVHVYTPAYVPSEMSELLQYSSHLTFNSLNQFHRYREAVISFPKPISIGLRVNPEFSDVTTALYNPASPQSRLGMTSTQLPAVLPQEIEGLHFHVLCESSAQALAETLDHFERRFGDLLPTLKWVNMGGGHLITRSDYDTALLVETLRNFKRKHGVDIILEPGSAFAWQTGFLLTTVLDIIENGEMKTAIIDASFTCHMPDCLEMPYKPKIRGAKLTPDSGDYLYRIGGLSCLAGDFMEAYGFRHELQIGDRLLFEDMMHYTMVKTNHFNGVGHPAIGILKKDETFQAVRAFNYQDYKHRLS